MSPVAVRSPHTRAFSADGGQPVDMPSNGGNGVGTADLKGANRVFPHLDDLVTPKPSVDINSPLRTILLQGELLAKQADTHLDFRRPDIALQEYVSASVIAVEIVPRHPDYLALLKDRGDLHRLYTGLNKRITSQHKKFAEVKEIIKENNARSGVKPTTSGHLNGAASLHAQKQVTNDHANTNAGMASPQKRTAPVVQPKPDALYGRALPHSNGGGNVSDLAARFARLQNGGPVQDPRIKTRPISVPETQGSSAGPSRRPESRSSMIRPLGPRELPSVPKPQPPAQKIPLDVTIPGMPRPPDAIHHSPLRAVGNPETANLPSSVTRSSSFLTKGRKDSAPPISTVGPSPYSFDNRTEYFSSPTHSSHDDLNAMNEAGKRPSLPNSSSITAEELMQYLRQGQYALKLLIIDLRNREDFEAGHIMSQSTICVEPITIRSGMSGEELEDSMVIAPRYEQDLFEQRHEVDLLVFYDQSSTSIKRTSDGKDKDSTLRDFATAVYDYGYDKRLKHHPVLLAGGLESWIDLLGPNSLQASGASVQSSNGTSALTNHSAMQLRRGSSHASFVSKRRARASRLKSKEDENKWDQVLREDSTVIESGADDLVYARTQDDFFRRFPELPLIKESMVTPTTIPASAPFSKFEQELEGVMPRPPARPAPALPRQRSSGITEKNPSLHYTHAAGPAISNLRHQPGLTGLFNTGVTCYMNSALQLISATRPLREFLITFTPGSVSVPAKSGEASPPLQLMTRSLGNLLSHMWSGQYDYLTPTTFRRYVNALHCTTNISEKLREKAFGGSERQHDSSEFLQWLLVVLDDELNPKRDSPERVISDSEQESLGAMSEIQAAATALTHLMEDKGSFLTSSMTVMSRGETACNTTGCSYRTRNYTLDYFINVPISYKLPRSVTLESLLTGQFGLGSEERVPYKCEKCEGDPRASKSATRSFRFARMPDVLFMNLNRTQFDQDTMAYKKGTAKITFNETVDLSSIFISRQGARPNDLPGIEYTPPFRYQVTSIICHSGATLDSGHYVTFSRVADSSGGSAWYLFNDSSEPRRVSFASIQGDATILSLQRIKDTPTS